MNLKTKKVIAREFLLLLLCIATTAFVFLGVYLYSSYKSNKVDELIGEIKANKIIIDSLQSSISIEYDEYGIPIRKKWDFSAFDEAVNNQKEDPFKEFGGHQLPPLPPKKIILELASKRKLIKETTIKLEKYSEQILSSTEQIRILLFTFLVSVSCIFVFRYLFYGMRWSISTLKEK